ncbi:hypothetical protein JXB01_04220, partial [Candidatus Micrarchaeota archaeon]|nr:hypothetical protein [Candidatus Micrarchaeota archaeon]
DKEYFEKLYSFIKRKLCLKPYYRIRGRGLRLSIYSKSFFIFLTEVIGIPKGIAKRKMGIPSCFLNSRDLSTAFIRGLFDTDGSVFSTNKPGFLKYPSIEITNTNKTMIFDVYEILIKSGFRAHIRLFSRIYKLSLNGPKMIFKWHKEIGSSNPYKTRKIISILECFDTS